VEEFAIHVPYGLRDVGPFHVEMVGADGCWRVMVFPGLARKPDTAQVRRPPKAARA
jgi:hypothetical protein